MIPRDGVFGENAAFVSECYRKYGASAGVYASDVAASLLPAFLKSVKDGETVCEALALVGESAESLLVDPGTREAFAKSFSRMTALTLHDFIPFVAQDRPLRVLYTRVGAADRVFRSFSERLGDARVDYTPNNNTATEAVEAGDGDFVLLPFADAFGNRVPTAQALADLHGLLLTALLSVRVGEDELVYGAYGRTVLAPDSSSQTVLIQIPEPEADRLAGLFSVSSSQKVTIDGLRTLPGTQTVEIALTGSCESLLPVALFAILFFAGTTFTGLYRSEMIPVSD